MGIFSFLAKKRPPVNLKINEVEAWLESYVESLGVSNRVSSFRKDMANKVTITHTLLEKLAAAELANDNIPARAKNLMKGNREQYITQITRFLASIDIPEKYADINKFAVRFSENMETLAADTQRSFYIIREFFGSEAGAVATKIKDMDKTIVDFRTFLERQGLQGVQKVKNSLDDYKATILKREELKDEAKQRRADRAPHEQQIAKIEKRLDNLKNSHRYHNLKELQNKQEGIDEEIATAARPFLTNMSTLSRPMRKLAKMSTRDKIISDYLKSPSDTLVKDESLVLTSVLGELKKSLNKLGLKDKKIDEYTALIDSMTKPWLVEQQLAIKGKTFEKDEIAKRLKNDSTMLLVREQESWMQAQQEKLTDIDADLQRIDDELVSKSLTLAWQQIRDAVLELDEHAHVKKPK